MWYLRSGGWIRDLEENEEIIESGRAWNLEDRQIIAAGIFIPIAGTYGSVSSIFDSLQNGERSHGRVLIIRICFHTFSHMPAHPPRSPLQLFGFSILCLMHLSACSYQRLHFPRAFSWFQNTLLCWSLQVLSRWFDERLPTKNREHQYSLEHEPLECWRYEPR